MVGVLREHVSAGQGTWVTVEAPLREGARSFEWRMEGGPWHSTEEGSIVGGQIRFLEYLPPSEFVGRGNEVELEVRLPADPSGEVFSVPLHVTPPLTLTVPLYRFVEGETVSDLATEWLIESSCDGHVTALDEGGPIGLAIRCAGDGRSPAALGYLLPEEAAIAAGASEGVAFLHAAPPNVEMRLVVLGSDGIIGSAPFRGRGEVTRFEVHWADLGDGIVPEAVEGLGWQVLSALGQDGFTWLGDLSLLGRSWREPDAPQEGVPTIRLVGGHSLFSPSETNCEASSVPLRIVDGRLLVDVRIDGRGPWTFAIDTGWWTNGMVSRDSLDKLGLSARDGSAVTMGGTRFSTTLAQSIELGEAEFGGVALLVHDTALGDAEDGAILGLLGLGLFTRVRFVLDLPAGRMELGTPALGSPGSTGIVDVMQPGTSAVVLEVAGRPIVASIDTGDPGGLSLPASQLEHALFSTPPRDTGLTEGLAFRQRTSEVRLSESVTLAGLPLHRQVVAITQEDVGRVGVGVLRHLRVHHDGVGGRLRLEGSVPPSHSVAGFGLALMAGQAPGECLVADHLPGTPAGRAGLRGGDHVVAESGRPISDCSALSRSEARRLNLTIRRGEAVFRRSLARELLIR